MAADQAAGEVGSRNLRSLAASAAIRKCWPDAPWTAERSRTDRGGGPPARTSVKPLGPSQGRGGPTSKLRRVASPSAFTSRRRSERRAGSPSADRAILAMLFEVSPEDSRIAGAGGQGRSGRARRAVIASQVAKRQSVHPAAQAKSGCPSWRTVAEVEQAQAGSTRRRPR